MSDTNSTEFVGYVYIDIETLLYATTHLPSGWATTKSIGTPVEDILRATIFAEHLSVHSYAESVIRELSNPKYKKLAVKITRTIEIVE